MDINAPPSVPRARTGLAVAALILGIVAFLTSVFLVGAMLGVLGILLGAIHLSKRQGPNGMAWAGIGLSVLGIGISIGLGTLYFKAVTALRVHGSGEPAVLQAQAADDPFAPWIGRELPDFTVTDLKGEKLQSTALRGRRVILDFWATWCPPCRRELPHFIRLANEHPDEELLIIGISSEDEQTLSTFAEKEGIPYPIVSADDLPAPFDAIQAIPTTFFIDRNGIIQNVVVGYHDYPSLKEMALNNDAVIDGKDAPAARP